MSDLSGTTDNPGSRLYGEALELEGIGGALHAEETIFPHELKRPPKFALSVNGEEVDLTRLLATPLTPEQREGAITHMIQKGYDRTTAAYWIDQPFVGE